VERWVGGGQKMGIFCFLRHLLAKHQVSGQWAHAYHCSGKSTLGRVDANGPTVLAAG